MRAAFCIATVLAFLYVPAFAAKLPVRDGRYVRIEYSCDGAPMSVQDVIVHGGPIYAPQFGMCENRIVKRSKHLYVVSAKCDQDTPPVTTYRIVSRTEFTWETEFGQGHVRWCGGF